VGFGDRVEDLIKRLEGTDEKKRLKSFKRAFDRAMEAVNDEKLKPLFEQEKFQKEVIGALLDPVNGFDVQAFSQQLGDKLPEMAHSLRRFFNTLENALIMDEDLGPVFDRYQKLQYQRDIQEAIKRNKSALQPRELVKNVFAPERVSVQTQITKTIVGDIYNIYLIPQGDTTFTQDKFERTLSEYLRWVKNTYSKARLYGVESMQAGKGKPVRELADVFIPVAMRSFKTPGREELESAAKGGTNLADKTRAYLKLVDERQGKGEEVTLENMFSFGNKLAIVGGAGSGKSTLLAYLAVVLSNSVQEGAAALPFGIGKPVPIIVPLRYYREYANYCKQSPQEIVREARTGTLAGFIPWHLKRQSAALGLSEDFFDRLLLGGGCLVMIDGLDEITCREERGMVRHQVENLANDVYPFNWFIVTAREAGYRENAVFGDDFARFDVQGLNEEQIDTLVRNWCNRIYPGEEEAKAEELAGSIKHINGLRAEGELQPLVSTPLMVTMVVSVKWGETELPRERAKLYEAAVKVILQSQYIPEDSARKDLIEWGGPWEEQREWLAFLAYEMHRGGEDGAAVPEERIREILQERISPDNLRKFIEAVRYRGGLLEERAELFQFVHLTFQEFLTARYFAKERHNAFSNLKGHITEAWWREALLLAYGFAKTDYAPFAKEYIDWLSGLQGDDVRLAGLEMAGSALLEIEKPEQEVRSEQAGKLSKCLFEPKSRTSAILRSRAGVTLARLGDPRPEVMEIDRMQFCYLPAGSFLMGSHKQQYKEAYDNEIPQSEISLPGFYMGRIPVTNAQYSAFVKTDGYEDSKYWTKDGWDCRNMEKIDRNYDFGAPFNLMNHLVVGVSWYEALAFTKWLNERWLGQNKMPKGMKVKLPSEAEWEKAARGGIEIPGEHLILSLPDIRVDYSAPLETNPNTKRIYPWGNDPDSNKANCYDTGISATSAVGCFPDGAGPYGCEEMSGNVWEWTRSIYKEYPYGPNDGRENIDASKDKRRVLRGGAFSNNQQGVRCASRSRYDPSNRNYDIGFRVVLSPF